jgi:uncharacterized protein YhbP (UPF0306 family)
MIDRRIVKFLKKHHVLTIATSVDNKPWCASCFYVFLEKENALVFTSDLTTRHGREFLMNTLVAGTVALETMITGMIRGVQFEGTVSEPGPDLENISRNAYLKKFPVAMLMETHLWILRLTHIKYTDNRLGFGKKLIWKAE